MVKPRETRAELQSHLKVEEEKARHERWKEKAVLLAVLVGLSVIAAACLVVVFFPGPSEDKKWAMSILAAIVSGGLGYLGGKSARAG